MKPNVSSETWSYKRAKGTRNTDGTTQELPQTSRPTTLAECESIGRLEPLLPCYAQAHLEAILSDIGLSRDHLLQLLLRPKLVGVAADLLAAVGGAHREARIADTADLSGVGT